MADRVEIDFSEMGKITAKLGAVRDRIRRGFPLASQLASDARVMIEMRTSRGIDADFNRFPRYSTKPYYRSRDERPVAKGGRRTRKNNKKKAISTVFYQRGYAQFAAATKGTRTVNLHATGDMFRSLQARGGSETAQVMFTRAREALKALYVSGQKGDFVKINSREVKILQENANEIIRGLLHDQGLL